MMNVLVTGGAGFIGSNLVSALVQKGNRVTVIDNLSTGHKHNLPLAAINFIAGDIKDAALLNDVTQDIEVIFHLAAAVGNKRSVDHPFDDLDVNGKGTLTVLEAARKNQVRKVIVSSSAGIFGEIKKTPINEYHPIAPITPYGASKLYCEKLALAYAELYPMEVICLRYFNVYGRHQWSDPYGSVIPIFVTKLLSEDAIEVYGDGTQTRDFVAVEDVVAANIQASITTELSGMFNIGSGIETTINELIEQLREIFGNDIPVRYGPRRACDVHDCWADISAASLAFNYHPKIPFNKGLREYVNWLRSQSLMTADV